MATKEEIQEIREKGILKVSDGKEFSVKQVIVELMELRTASEGLVYSEGYFEGPGKRDFPFIFKGDKCFYDDSEEKGKCIWFPNAIDENWENTPSNNDEIFEKRYIGKGDPEPRFTDMRGCINYIFLNDNGVCRFIGGFELVEHCKIKKYWKYKRISEEMKVRN